MATVINLLDLKNKISENVERYIIDKSVNSLILLSPETLRSSGSTTLEITLNTDPKIVCSFYAYVHQTYYVSINVNFKPNVPDTFKYELSLYHINSQMNLNIPAVLNVENITEKSTFNFMHSIKIFKYDAGNPNLSLCGENLTDNKHLCLYCRITRKDAVIPLKVKIPENVMGQEFLSLYENKTLTDFKIICKDNQEFLVHKVVLAARSPVFKAMVEHDFQESQKNEVEISDFRPEIVAQMLRYIYTDNIDTSKEEIDVKALIAIADKYGLKKLKLLCLNEISKSVNNVADALDAFSIAENYHVAEFKEMALEFIKNNRHNL